MLSPLIHSSALRELCSLGVTDPQALPPLSLLLRLLNGEASPFDRSLPEHVTVSALVHRLDSDALLMIHHARLRRWLYPGGHVEPDLDDSLLAAARRECLEETGLDPAGAAIVMPAPIDIDAHAIPATPREPAHVHVDVRYLFRLETCDRGLSDGSWVARSKVAAHFPESIGRPARRLAPEEHAGIHDGRIPGE